MVLAKHHAFSRFALKLTVQKSGWLTIAFIGLDQGWNLGFTYNVAPLWTTEGYRAPIYVYLLPVKRGEKSFHTNIIFDYLIWVDIIRKHRWGDKEGFTFVHHCRELESYST